jgi:hypothetical protein
MRRPNSSASPPFDDLRAAVYHAGDFGVYGAILDSGSLPEEMWPTQNCQRNVKRVIWHLTPGNRPTGGGHVGDMRHDVATPAINLKFDHADHLYKQ